MTSSSRNGHDGRSSSQRRRGAAPAKAGSNGKPASNGHAAGSKGAGRRSKPLPETSRAARRPLAAVVLAAGQGKRMRSRRAKVLHEVAGRPLLLHVLDAIAPLDVKPVVVVIGHERESVAEAVRGRAETAVQEQQLGTGHAVLQARKALAGFDGDVLVLSGDVPLLRTETFREMVRLHRRVGAQATVLSAVVEDSTGYGRIVRGDGEGRIRIVEETDATDDERAIQEINTGTWCFRADFLFRQLAKLGRDNAQGEYYLTDLIEAASAAGAAACVTLEDGEEGHGVNTRADLARIENLMQERLIERAMDAGVTFLDPASAVLSAATEIGADTTIGPNVRLEGEVRIGSGCVLEGSIHLRNTVVGDGALLRWGVVADAAAIGRGAKVGPFAHLRPDAELGESVHIGNFVEVKKATIGARSKANHLAYIGDSTVGVDVNIGAGTITCNYDGFEKHRTVIGDRVQIGSDTQLVAPVTVGADAYIAAGSTISRPVEAGSLAFNEKPQRVRTGWVEAFRARKAAAKAAASKGQAAKAAASRRQAAKAAASKGPAAKAAASEGRKAKVAAPKPAPPETARAAGPSARAKKSGGKR